MKTSCFQKCCNISVSVRSICKSVNGQAHCLGKSLLIMGVVSLELHMTQEGKAGRFEELKIQLVWYG